MRYDVSSSCKPFPVITHISCHPVNYFCIKDSPVALFPLDKGEKWPTSTWTSVVHAFANPPRPGQTSPDQSMTGCRLAYGRALPARRLPRLKGESDRRAANPTNPDINYFNLHLHDKWWQKGRRGKETNTNKKENEEEEMWKGKTGLQFSYGHCVLSFSLYFFCLYSILLW